MSKPEEIQLPKLYNWGPLKIVNEGDWFKMDSEPYWRQSTSTWKNTSCYNIWRPTPPPAPPRFVLTDMETGKKYKWVKFSSQPSTSDFFISGDGARMQQVSPYGYPQPIDLYEPLED